MARLAWKTPVIPLPGDHGDVHLKLECLQRSGSFKLRGATNRLLTLSEKDREGGVVTCSSGNHGRAVAEASEALGIRATVCVPDWTDPVKAHAIEEAGARLISAGSTYDEAERTAARLAEAEGLRVVHPFDDMAVIEGQGTVGSEILEQLPGVTEVLVPLSGGGLVAGIALSMVGTGVRVVAVSAERASVMHQSLTAGGPVTLPEEATLATALSGGIGLDNRHTFRLVRDLVDDFVLVPEEAIVSAVCRAFRELKLVVEGGGAVALAAIWSGLWQPEGKTAIVVSGGNLDPDRLAELLRGSKA
ncbi:MAG: threonine ammonia-lyase [Longimicrobiales bacterium]